MFPDMCTVCEVWSEENVRVHVAVANVVTVIVSPEVTGPDDVIQ